jgi:hypothetical protein
MKKLLFVTIFVTLLLTACGQGGVKADVPETTEAKATQVIVNQFIDAYKTSSADLLISLFHDQYIFMDYGLNDGPWVLDNSSTISTNQWQTQI